MTLPARLDNCLIEIDGPAKGYHVIARAIGPWQSASSAVQSTARPQRGRKENGLPRRAMPSSQ